MQLAWQRFDEHCNSFSTQKKHTNAHATEDCAVERDDPATHSQSLKHKKHVDACGSEACASTKDDSPCHP